MTDQRAELPGGSKPMSYEQVDRMRVDAKGRLTWDGDLVQVQKAFRLTFWQGLATSVISLGAASQGALALYQLGCAMAIWSKGCSR